VGLRAGLDWCENLAPPGFDLRTVQPVGTPHTDYATRPTLRIIYVIYRVSQEEWTKLRESVPYVKLYR